MFMKGDFFHKAWALGFVRGGMAAVMSNNPLKIDVVKNPYKDRWFADPFVLDVTDTKILLLVEELRYSNPVGRIAKLTIDRKRMAIEKMDIILECPKHLSFPNIFRKDGKVYVYPENCQSGSLNIYEYDAKEEKLNLIQSICDYAIWDSTMTNLFGEYKLIGGCSTDYSLDIFKWDAECQRFVPEQSVKSDLKDNRLAGDLFEYDGKVYCPTQDCTKTYGGGICLKTMVQKDGQFILKEEKHLTSPVKGFSEGMHTINQYKGVVVVDLKGWKNPIAGLIYNTFRLIKPKKK